MKTSTITATIFVLAILLIGAATAYSTVIIESSGMVTITRNTGTNTQAAKVVRSAATTGKGDYFAGFADGYNAGQLDGENNKHSRSNPCIYAPYNDCSYYKASDYPYNLYNDYNKIYYPQNQGYYSLYQGYRQ